MSSSNDNSRAWMYQDRWDSSTGLLTTEFGEGLKQFMQFATQQERCLETGRMFCPCPSCDNNKFLKVDKVWKHLYQRGFRANYKVWYYHGEVESVNVASTSEYVVERLEEHMPPVENIGMVQMVNDAFREDIPSFMEDENRVEEPNLEAKRFFDMLDAAKHPIYEGCREGLSPLSTATRMMTIKTDHNLSKDCVDAWADLIKDLLPVDNLAPASYHEIEKLVCGLGLPYHMIDVCIDNCMIYWKEDANYVECRFCHKPRFQITGGRVRVPFKRMWYLPLTDRLRRLYQSERTAGPMRWHAEHTNDGQISHPSDAKAWKHFQSLYPDFAKETRNVYLGLCTDGFSPFGKHGRKYSLWPVILTPYNLPPSLCMKREFLFLTILVPGPEHPKRSLDVFLQPLIHELKELWEHGVQAFDVSCKQNFRMSAVLMWTISDFPAYGMLSGWSTHGKLACPYCNDDTDAFQLKHGRKTCWFDCHRRFLPISHPYRRSKTAFKTGNVVRSSAPPLLDGDYLERQMRDFGVEKTVECGGNGHFPVQGCGEFHNWHKKSIFWDLPYWKNHLLRHNLDVMHIEKNFFDNIMNTILNVQGKTKDNLKSRLDLPNICSREELHVMPNGKGPIPIFRLQTAAKEEFFQWIIHSVKFADGYASHLRNCVDSQEGRLSGMKCHDCHVFMQRLIPFAFAELLPSNVHEAVAGIGAFFRDLCSRSFTINGMKTLEDNIPILICNLEKIFPPSFFDVMEHLPIHLPLEAALGGPVQYRWMYPFERFMYHLKKKVKNLSKVEGSIVAQSINEETSHFSTYYFDSHVQTKSRKTVRNDDGGVKPQYIKYVPDIFAQTGRVSGKQKKRWLSDQELTHLHTYILLNCDDILPYESIYIDHLKVRFPDLTEEEIGMKKQTEFAEWLNIYVRTWSMRGHEFPQWLTELVYPPLTLAISSPMYYTRGYAFKIYREKNTRSTVNSGISAQAGDTSYYGVLKEILEVEYAGIINMKCIVFMCDWYDPSPRSGVRYDKFGVTQVNSAKRLRKYDPFILASQADQVCYIPYPRVIRKKDPWITVTQINPRGRVHGVQEHDPLQENFVGFVNPTAHSVEDIHLVDLEQQDIDDILEISEDELDEFEELSDSASSEYSSDSE